MRNAFKYLSQYSTTPKDVDRLIISAFLEINKLKLQNNRLLKAYCISQSDSDEYISLIEFVRIVNSETTKFSFEKLIEIFEFVISPADRIINGAVYTPAHIREYIVKETIENKYTEINDSLKIADIACGCGGFLYTASTALKKKTNKKYSEIFKDHIFGLDIQDYSINRTKLLLSLVALKSGEDVDYFNFNLFHGDSLDFNWSSKIDSFEGFEIIIGNPPYVCARNLEEGVKEKLKTWSVCRSGNPDLYIPFFQIGYENLSKNGMLSFITMNTFFKSLNGRALRKYFEDNKASIQIVDFGTLQIFKSKTTYTCICFITNIHQDYVEYYKSIDKEFPQNKNQFNKINYTDLNARKGWNLNSNSTISKIESTGTPFGELYKTRHGIATLKNDIYIFKPVAEDKDFYYLQNGELYPIEKGICKDILNSNKLSRPIDLGQTKEKVLFPYNEDQKPRAIEEFLFKEQFPMAYQYLKKKKIDLSGRDKGKGRYEKWYAFGRTQSLSKVKNKLFFPKFSDQIPNYLISTDDNLLFYNGQAVIGHTEEEMRLIKKIMESNVFWYYIKTTSKPYSSNYYSLNGNYIRNFGICDLNTEERRFLVKEKNKKILDQFFLDKYEVII